MIRARFTAEGAEDYRPVKWPIKHPYWCTGYDSSGSPIIVAYADDEEEIKQNWPEATGIDAEPADICIFTDRFAKPSWFKQ